MATKLATLVAVGAAVKEAELKEAKKSLKPGKYKVDIHVHIHGEIEKKEDGEMRGSGSLKWQMFCTMLLNEMPAEQRSKIKKQFVASIGNDDKTKKLQEAVKGSDGDKIIEEIRESCPMVSTTGKVGSILEVDFIEDTENHVCKK